MLPRCSHDVAADAGAERCLTCPNRSPNPARTHVAANTSPLAPAPSGAPIASAPAATAEAADGVRGGGGAHAGFPASDTQHSAGIAASSAGTCPAHGGF